jgi:hypothetical protein
MEAQLKIMTSLKQTYIFCSMAFLAVHHTKQLTNWFGWKTKCTYKLIDIGKLIDLSIEYFMCIIRLKGIINLLYNM